MKNLLIILALFCVVKANGQNYQITFAGTGASATVTSVKVENLTSGTSVNIAGADILHLTSVSTGVNSLSDNQFSKIKIYPNPATDYATVQIYPPASGEAVITILDIAGRPVTQAQYYLENSIQSFRFSGFNTGIYVIDVKGIDYKLSGKLVSNGKSSGNITIEKTTDFVQVSENIKSSDASKGNMATIDMTYATGDRLRFTGVSGVYSTIVTDIPASDKLITFNFLACKDGDNNDYPVVTINNQYWMAENLKTLKYRNGDVIGTTTPATLDITAESTPKYQWAYDGNESNVASFGRLYTYYAITDNRNVCPTGWRVPTDADWTVLTNYLTSNGYGYQGSGTDIGKSMASATGWNTEPTAGTVGNSQTSNNSSGFKGVPAGYRNYTGSFSSTGSGAFWWSSTEFSAVNGIARSLRSYNDYVDNFYHSKQYGNSVRCIKE
jgi:uncharacterized protein (TIGR02145 family)